MHTHRGTLTLVHRFVTPVRRFFTLVRHFVTYRSPSGKFAVRRAVSNESKGKSDEASAIHVATADKHILSAYAYMPIGVK
ncbi:hypothetical protein [Prevotellamassilia timonensis]|uniref:hypothetical protein n=1 Tax=Prevotellamassilia timonensis TaxID=1852370 RepID=UPI001F248E6E|nr:hypothetical protein [Prevotellamassilia timonensis]